MNTIVLRSDLYRVLEQNAQEEARSVGEIVNEAVEHYLREQQRAKLNREIHAYEALHAELR
ncbi:MAG: hypothetical protein ACLFTI_09045 [Anaerolineales bacterium]